MVHLTLVGLSEDRTRLLLVNDSGAEFTLGVDTSLRAAVRGEHARLGQLEIEMDSALRPRDIQARIRAGETPDAVASAAKTTVDTIMPYASPVLAERAHVADRAQRSSVRRRAAETPEGPARSRTLGDAVAGHLRGLNVSVDTVTWDAFRREDGRWTLTGDFAATQRKGSALFAFDAPGNFVVTENDDARWLIGDLAPEPADERPPAARRPSKERRLSAVPSDELPLGDDAIEMVNGPDASDTATTADLTETAARVRAASPPVEPGDGADDGAGGGAGGGADGGLERASAGHEPSFFDSVLAGDRAGVEPVVPASEAATAEEPPAQPPARKKSARASVPSWDEIMFGGGKQE